MELGDGHLRAVRGAVVSPRTLFLGKCSAALVCGLATWRMPELTWLFLGGGLAAFAMWDWLAATAD